MSLLSSHRFTIYSGIILLFSLKKIYRNYANDMAFFFPKIIQFSYQQTEFFLYYFFVEIFISLRSDSNPTFSPGSDPANLTTDPQYNWQAKLWLCVTVPGYQLYIVLYVSQWVFEYYLKWYNIEYTQEHLAHPVYWHSLCLLLTWERLCTRCQRGGRPGHSRWSRTDSCRTRTRTRPTPAPGSSGTQAYSQTYHYE